MIAWKCECHANVIEPMARHSIGDVGSWFDDVNDKMLLAFDTYEVYPEEFWKEYAEKNNIEMWMLR